jgi:hypothetical protein
MRVAIPNFVVIGAAKAATTSVHAWLSQHPQIFLPKQKELHFFAGAWLRENCNGPGDRRVLQNLPPDWGSYLAHYRGVSDELAIGDISPSYFSWWPSRDAIRDKLGRPRIVLLLRNPVDKAFSQYMHLVRDGRETLTFWDALHAEPQRIEKGYGALWRYLESSLYAERTERFLETFGPTQMKVLLFDELLRSPHDFMRDLLTFVGVDPGVPIETSEARNRSGRPRSRALATLVNSPSLRAAARAVLPSALVTRLGRRVTKLNTGVKPEIDSRSIEWLSERIAPDLRRLESLLGRSVPWLN